VQPVGHLLDLRVDELERVAVAEPPADARGRLTGPSRARADPSGSASGIASGASSDSSRLASCTAIASTQAVPAPVSEAIGYK
jgi:hypothetical protein